VAGAAAIGAGYFAYKEHEKSEEEVKSHIDFFDTWLTQKAETSLHLGTYQLASRRRNPHARVPTVRTPWTGDLDPQSWQIHSFWCH
jgi:hypothetical protein